MNKQQIAEHFNVSTVTVGNWLSRGMPYRKRGAKGKGYEFDLATVIKWRDERIQAECTPAPPDAPEMIQERPDLQNGLRFFSEESVRHFIWYFIQHDEGIRFLLAQFREAGWGHEKSYREMQAFIYVLYGVFIDWVSKDKFFTEGTSDISDADEAWEILTREKIRTRPPLDPDRILLQLPDWVLMKPEEYVSQYWPEKVTTTTEETQNDDL